VNGARTPTAVPSPSSEEGRGERVSAPLSPREFSKLFDHLGPFEADPVIAVGVSGGPDSLALTLLLADWAAARGGTVHALTVDHGLRPESGAEARQVGAWLVGRPRIEHHVLRWEGAKPTSGLQTKARAARYDLMVKWCGRHDVRHLAVAHHLDDQIETYLMRQAHGSGELGLAGMSVLREIGGVRLLRPLLRVSKSRLLATLRARGESWIEDPSNRDLRFERVRLRAAARELDPADLYRRIALLGAKRAALEAAASALLADTVAIDPSGYATLSPQAWVDADMAVVELAFSRLLRAIGGREYLPGPGRLSGVLNWLRSSELKARRRGWTLGGCALTRRRGVILVFRDWGAIRDRRPIVSGETLIWDRRFRVKLEDMSTNRSDKIPPGEIRTIGPLGEAGLQQMGAMGTVSLSRHPMPESARKALPALWNGRELLGVPHLGLGKALNAVLLTDLKATSCGFTVAYATTHTMYGNEK
jgi:tRNA(Ile)-lysidine synthase